MYKYNSEDQKLVNKMMGMGFYISNNGFQYIMEAAKIINGCNSHPRMTGTGGIYDSIAKKFNTTSTRVERCIRTEIERYYSARMDIPEALECDMDSGKLTNTEFLARLTNILYADEEILS